MLIQRVSVRFSKKGELTAISHLDLMRVFERALRRAGLPLRMSEGFNPRPRLSFPAPLGVGIQGRDEIMEFVLSEWMPLQDVEDRLGKELPEGIGLLSVGLGDPHHAARVAGMTYAVAPSEAVRDDPRLGADALAEFMARDEVPVRRIRKKREKTVNIRPFIRSLRWEGGEIVVRLNAGPDGTTRPEEILGALGVDGGTCRSQFRIMRTAVGLAE